jgi:hypothetical protein
MKILILFILYITSKQCENIFKQDEKDLINLFKKKSNTLNGDISR